MTEHTTLTSPVSAWITACVAALVVSMPLVVAADEIEIGPGDNLQTNSNALQPWDTLVLRGGTNAEPNIIDIEESGNAGEGRLLGISSGSTAFKTTSLPFADGFESGDTSAWSAAVGAAPPATFLSTFESGTTDADIGTAFIMTTGGASMYVTTNPDPDSVNSSSVVLRIEAPPGSIRGEYHTSPSERLPTDESTHIYTWMRYYPDTFLDGVSRNWLLLSQWKTWPCEEYGVGDYAYGDVICNTGGIFNEARFDAGDTVSYEFRAYPDCGSIEAPLITGEWLSYVLEIYWTNTDAGYYRLYRNNVLLGEASGVKTLFDRFPTDDSCNIYWSNGLYSSWSSSGATSMFSYVDDMAVYLAEDGVTLADVCPLCE